jgi:hypothetical protein
MLVRLLQAFAALGSTGQLDPHTWWMQSDTCSDDNHELGLYSRQGSRNARGLNLDSGIVLLTLTVYIMCVPYSPLPHQLHQPLLSL